MMNERFGFKIGDRVRYVDSENESDIGIVVAFSTLVEIISDEVYFLYNHKGSCTDVPKFADREFDYSKGWECERSYKLVKV